MQKYKKKLAEYENKLKNYEDFDYNAETDELLRLQRAQLERDRTDGVSDVLARYAANTGMAGSSAAMAAAQQTASRYDSMIADALADAEQKAYERWASEKKALEGLISQTQSEARSEADSRLKLGDVSGYRELGYDTAAYETERAFSEAERRAQYGDTSALEALGVDVSVNSDNAQSSTASEKEAERGGNGMTRAEYESEVDRLTKEIRSLERSAVGWETDRKIKLLYARLEALDRAYYSIPEYYTADRIEELLTDLALSSSKVVSYPQYLALARYYNEKGGEKYLREQGVTYYKGY